MRLATVAVLVFLLAACDEPSPPKPAAPVSRPVTGKEAACLPCGGSHVFEVTEKTARTEVDGQTYYFCSDRCKEVFLKDPKKYVK